MYVYMYLTLNHAKHTLKVDYCCHILPSSAQRRAIKTNDLVDMTANVCASGRLGSGRCATTDCKPPPHQQVRSATSSKTDSTSKTRATIEIWLIFTSVNEVGEVTLSLLVLFVCLSVEQD